MFTHQFRTTFDLPATLCRDNNNRFGQLRLMAFAEKNNQSVSIGPVEFHLNDDTFSLHDYNDCLIQNYNDSPEQFESFLHDHMQSYVEHNWPLPEWDGPDETDTDEHEYINSLSVRPFTEEEYALLPF